MDNFIAFLVTFYAQFSTCNSHTNVDGHLTISSYLNPLAGIPNVSVLSSGILELQYLNAFAPILNYTFDVKPPQDVLAVGVMLPNKSWTGGMGQLQRGEVDVFGSLMTMTPLKYSVADPATPIFFEETVIVIPYAFHHSDTGITSPFSPASWILLGVAIVVGSIVMIIAQQHLRHWKIFWVFGIISVFASVRVPQFGMHNRHDSRLILTTCLIAVVLLRTYYTAEITSMVAEPNPKFAFKSIEEVAKQITNGVKVLVAKGSTSEEYFMTSSNPAIKKIGDFLRQHPEYLFHYETDLKNMYEMVDPKTVLIQPRMVAEGMIHQDFEDNGRRCRFSLAPKGFNPKAQTIAFPKGSILPPKFTGEILDQLRFGTLSYMKRQITWSDRQPCTSMESIDPGDLLLLENLMGAFWLLITGTCLAFLAFLLELIVWKCNNIAQE